METTNKTQTKNLKKQENTSISLNKNKEKQKVILNKKDSKIIQAHMLVLNSFLLCALIRVVFGQGVELSGFDCATSSSDVTSCDKVVSSCDYYNSAYS